MNRTVARRLERLGVSAAPKSFSCRIYLVDPEKGLTGILVLESGKPTMHVLPTRKMKNGSAPPQNGVQDRTDIQH